MIIRFVDVIGKWVFAGEEAKVLGFDSNVPKSSFPTSGTIASTGFCWGFDVGFEFDGATNTASVVLFCCHLVQDAQGEGDGVVGRTMGKVEWWCWLRIVYSKPYNEQFYLSTPPAQKFASTPPGTDFIQSVNDLL